MLSQSGKYILMVVPNSTKLMIVMFDTQVVVAATKFPWIYISRLDIYLKFVQATISQ